MNKLPALKRAQMEERSIRAWKRPEIRRLRAGDAEIGGALVSDGGLTNS
ncbi:MAG TPA: hypothetical protein VGF77_00370 [Allosphingosinicella sp.]|jgi:hypothetical protein